MQRRTTDDAFVRGHHRKGRKPLILTSFRGSTTASLWMLMAITVLRMYELINDLVKRSNSPPHTGLPMTASGNASVTGGQRAEEPQGPGKAAEYDSSYDVARRNMIKAIAELYKEEMKRQVTVSPWKNDFFDFPRGDALFSKKAPPPLLEFSRVCFVRENLPGDEISMEDATLCDNGPKEISIFCSEPPEIKIVDLSQDHRGNNECLILNINAPDVSSQLVLKCDGSTSDGDFGWGEAW